MPVDLISFQRSYTDRTRQFQCSHLANDDDPIKELGPPIITANPTSMITYHNHGLDGSQFGPVDAAGSPVGLLALLGTAEEPMDKDLMSPARDKTDDGVRNQRNDGQRDVLRR